MLSKREARANEIPYFIRVSVLIAAHCQECAGRALQATDLYDQRQIAIRSVIGQQYIQLVKSRAEGGDTGIEYIRSWQFVPI